MLGVLLLSVQLFSDLFKFLVLFSNENSVTPIDCDLLLLLLLWLIGEISNRGECGVSCDGETVLKWSLLSICWEELDEEDDDADEELLADDVDELDEDEKVGGEWLLFGMFILKWLLCSSL